LRCFYPPPNTFRFVPSALWPPVAAMLVVVCPYPFTATFFPFFGVPTITLFLFLRFFFLSQPRPPWNHLTLDPQFTGPKHPSLCPAFSFLFPCLSSFLRAHLLEVFPDPALLPPLFHPPLPPRVAISIVDSPLVL